MADHDANSTPTQQVRIEVEGLSYAFDRAPRPQGRRSTVVVRLAECPDDHGFRDRVDLFAFRSRRSFAQRVADSFGRQVGEIMGALAVILDTFERERGPTTCTRAPEITPERQVAAEVLLQRPDLLDHVADAMERIGYVGEHNTKRLSYLVATSRLLTKPLSAILMAPSGCGKSELLEVVAKLMPAEQVEFLSRLTPQALYYAGADHLRHKLVIIDEHVGAAESDLSIRTLQSKGVLRLAVPGAEPMEVHGPISLMSGTTSADLNAENLSRVLELSLDDSPEQTKRIQEMQRRVWSGEVIHVPELEPWRDAQRLLESVEVIIPFAEGLNFPARTTHDRRGNQKLLGLVAAHALLHQRQREREGDRVVAHVDDYRVVYGLLQPVIRDDVDGLSPRAARAYRMMIEAEKPMTRRAVADKLGWSYMTSKRAIEELVAQEVVRVVDPADVPRRYILVEPETLLGVGAKLTPPEVL